MSRKLDNYLRTYRRLSGFSQKETVFLLDSEDDTKISRYEHGMRQPGLETALALRRIFGVSLDELFAGVFAKVDENIVKRAQLLAQKLNQCAPTPLNMRKLARLAAIASGPATGKTSSNS